VPRRKHLKTGRGQRGQIIIVAAILLPILLAMAGLAVDVGSYAAERRNLQNAADAIALAAARDLPDQTAAQASAQTYAAKNGIAPSNMTVTVTGGSTTPTVRVVINKSHSFAFMAIVGIGSRAVGGIASAGKFSLGGGSGVVPWAVTENTVNAATPGSLVTLKYDSTNANNGNFGIIDIDGQGSSVYGNSATYGASDTACSTATSTCGTTSCPGSFPSTCAENSPTCDGPDCDPETGNKVGDTQNAIDFRMQHTSANCDSFDEVFTQITTFLEPDAASDAPLLVEAAPVVGPNGKVLVPPQMPGRAPRTNTPTRTSTPVPTNTALPTATYTSAVPTATSPPAATSTATSPPTSTPTLAPTSVPGSGKFALTAACNPWTQGACDPAPSTMLCSRRVFILPIINGFGGGSALPVTILKFALFYLEGYQNGQCTGSSCTVTGRFINAEITTGAIAAGYDASAAVQFVKLIE